MLVVVLAALVVLAVVAVPKVREGRPLLTRDGRERVEQARRVAAARTRDARRKASDLAGQAADRTRSRGAVAPAPEQPAREEPAREEPAREEPVSEERAQRRSAPALAREQVVDLRTTERTATASPSPLAGPTRPLAWEQQQAPGPRHARH
jgi:hypothetical protein